VSPAERMFPPSEYAGWRRDDALACLDRTLAQIGGVS
jgi:hypothetical protein